MLPLRTAERKRTGASHLPNSPNMIIIRDLQRYILPSFPANALWQQLTHRMYANYSAIRLMMMRTGVI